MGLRSERRFLGEATNHSVRWAGRSAWYERRETRTTRLNRPLGMLQLPAMRKESNSRMVAGSNPARSTKFNAYFSRVLSVFCPNGSDFDQLIFQCPEIS